jgi:chromosome segregation ATPase
VRISIAPSKEELERKVAEVETEYQTYLKRVEVVSDPQYITILKQRILAIDVRIKKWEKHKKNMEYSQKKNEDLICRSETEEPEVLHELAELKKSLYPVTAKLAETDASLEKHAKTLSELGGKLAETKEKYYKMAAGSGISLGTEQISEISKRYEEIQTKKQGLEKTLNLIKTRHSVAGGEYAQKVGKLQQKLNEVAETVQGKREYCL